MTTLVLDTSVVIDLEHGQLLERAFDVEFEMVVPDLLYDRELAEYNGPELVALGLRRVELDATELTLAQERWNRNEPKLSLPDCYALTCAERNDHRLLTSDRALRALATAEGLAVSGLFWLLDEMENAGVNEAVLRAGLERIGKRPQCRLPRTEINARLSRWME